MHDSRAYRVSGVMYIVTEGQNTVQNEMHQRQPLVLSHRKVGMVFHQRSQPQIKRIIVDQ